mmetsp:Transcript_8765/g.16647  ORF Transcript_8765/g.16647 Transcript_8765/m.16647 type:complete len:94 (+) Transcript_8765:420-701(+)
MEMTSQWQAPYTVLPEAEMVAAPLRLPLIGGATSSSSSIGGVDSSKQRGASSSQALCDSLLRNGCGEISAAPAEHLQKRSGEWLEKKKLGFNI